MFTLSIIVLTLLILIGAVFFIECKIIEDLPEENEFKKWWRRHIIAPDPRG
jgi:hypothetical protein